MDALTVIRWDQAKETARELGLEIVVKSDIFCVYEVEITSFSREVLLGNFDNVAALNAFLLGVKTGRGVKAK
jgi:hypothetical protein